jgi:transcriptional regulator with XRE-family HTH domain
MGLHPKDTFSRRLVEAKLRTNLTWKQLAEAGGVTESTMQKAAHGRTEMLSKPVVLQKIAAALGVHNLWLYAGGGVADKFRPEWYRPEGV